MELAVARVHPAARSIERFPPANLSTIMAASLDIQIDVASLVRMETLGFQMVREKFQQTQTLPELHLETVLRKRLNLVKLACDQTDVYKAWGDVQKLVENYVDRDLWEACIKVEQRAAAASSEPAAGLCSS